MAEHEEVIDVTTLFSDLFNVRPYYSGVMKRKVAEKNAEEETTTKKHQSCTLVAKKVNGAELLEVVSLDDKHGGGGINDFLIRCDKKTYGNFAPDLRKFFNLSKAFRWMCAEFFYSSIDKPFFDNDNFREYMKSLYPLLETRMLARPEWVKLRSNFGSLRRFSSAFLECERMQLELHRRKAYLAKQKETGIPEDYVQLLPTGIKVMVRLKYPEVHGIYRGVIRSEYKRDYLIKFDRKELGTQAVHDFEVATQIFSDEIGNSGNNRQATYTEIPQNLRQNIKRKLKDFKTDEAIKDFLSTMEGIVKAALASSSSSMQ